MDKFRISLSVERHQDGVYAGFLWVNNRSFPHSIQSTTLPGILRQAAERPELNGIDALLYEEKE